MKQFLLLVFLSFLAIKSYSQKQFYFVLPDSITLKHTFIIGKDSCSEHFTSQKIVKGDKEYFQSVRQYSWGAIDTALFREGDNYFYSWDEETGQETIEMPKSPNVGEVWFESDSSWRYEIKSINAKLKTPIKKYKNLVIIEAEQLTGRDTNKFKKYYNYYSAGIGCVANVVDGELFCYLKDNSE